MFQAYCATFHYYARAMRLSSCLWTIVPLAWLFPLGCVTACSNGPSVGSGSGGGPSSGGGPTDTGGAPFGGTGGGATESSGGGGSGGVGPASGGSSSGGSCFSASGGQAPDIERLDDGSPLLLSQTGLYEPDMVTLAPGVRPFEPRFALWADTAEKKRWISLPDCAQIDTSDMNYWQFPAGTRVFKEFSRDGVRVETRMLTKRERGGWQRIAYQWRSDQTEGDARIDGVESASGTEHDIPSQEDCGTCHFQTPDKLLGFSAIQLAWDNPDQNAWTLDRLAQAGKLTSPPPTITLPGDDTAQAALGYMHANCGHCHNPRSSVTTRVTVSFLLTTGSLATVEETPTYQSTVCRDIELAEGGVPGITKIIDPGSPETSSVAHRMESRGEQYSMPPLATKLVDTSGRGAVVAWIQSLAGVNCAE